MIHRSFIWLWMFYGFGLCPVSLSSHVSRLTAMKGAVGGGGMMASGGGRCQNHVKHDVKITHKVNLSYS